MESHGSGGVVTKVQVFLAWHSSPKGTGVQRDSAGELVGVTVCHWWVIKPVRAETVVPSTFTSVMVEDIQNFIGSNATEVTLVVTIICVQACATSPAGTKAAIACATFPT